MGTNEVMSPGAFVRAARKLKAQTQEEFALSVDSHQSLISKYERGLVDPPGALIMHCMNIVRPGDATEVTEDSLIRLVHERLSGADRAAARAVIAALITGLG